MSRPNPKRWQAANSLAEQILTALRDSCERIEIAGSIRRRSAVVNDIEMVAVPKLNRNLFGESDGVPSKLDDTIAKLLTAGRFHSLLRNGPKWKRLALPQWSGGLDLFITTPDRWAVQMAIRTGPADLSKQLVTRRSWGGLLAEGCQVKDGKVWEGGQVVELKEEREFFERFITGGWIEPENRK